VICAGDSGRMALELDVEAERWRASMVKELAANEYAHTAPLTTPVEACFDWARELPDLVATSRGLLEFYLVVFRSIRKASADTLQLYSADAAAHDEARLSGGLLRVHTNPCPHTSLQCMAGRSLSARFWWHRFHFVDLHMVESRVR
jgi:hypothetical protein